jgi:hypothetical protein
MSACRVYSSSGLVRLWHAITVALRWSPSICAGLPTLFERPITTSVRPSRSSRVPAVGVGVVVEQ